MPSQPFYSKKSDLEVLCQRFLLQKFFSSLCYPLFNKGGFPFLYLSCFRNIQPVKTILASENEYCFFIAALASYRNNNGYCFIQCESKVCYSFCSHIVLMGHRGRQLIDELTCFVLYLPKL